MTNPNSSTEPQVVYPWPLAKLRPNQKNPRGAIAQDAPGIAELADSIREQGIVQPLLITPAGVVVAGHRRLAAAKLAGIESVPCVVREMSDVEQLEIMLVENLQREDLSYLQEARAYARLMEKGMTQVALSRKTGLSAHRISTRLQLLQLDTYVQQMFDRGELPINLAPVLLRIPLAERQRQVAIRAARQQLTVEDLRRIVERAAGVLSTPKPVPPTPRPQLPPSEPGDEGRGRGAPAKDAPGPNASPGRAEVMERMGAAANKAFTLGELRQHFEQVCCACGMSDLPEYCAECPMVQLVHVLLDAKGVQHAA